MHTLFLLNPTAGKTDCTQQLPQQINAAAARAGLAPEEYTIRITTHAGHARELARAAAAGAQQAGEPLRIFTAGGDGTFNEALTGAYGFAGTAVGCLPYGSGNDFLIGCIQITITYVIHDRTGEDEAVLHHNTHLFA